MDRVDMPGSTYSNAEALLRSYRGLIGARGTPLTIEVTAERVREFSHAVRWDDSAGEEPDVVPITFLFPDPIIIAEQMSLPRPRPFPNTIDGGTEWELKRSPRLGSTAILEGTVSEVTAKPGSARTGLMLFTVYEISASSSDGFALGRARGTSISYQGAA